MRQKNSVLPGLAASLAAPWNLLGLLTASKSFEANGILGNPKLNQRGLHVRRVALAHKMAARRRRALAKLISPADRMAFERDGFVVKGDFLPEEVFTTLQAQLAVFEAECRESTDGDTTQRKIAVGRRALAATPALRALVNSPEWRGLICFVGASRVAPMVFLQTLFRAGGCERPRDPQTRLHADTFHPTVKAWFFLTDVAEADGPFTYVPGSHRLSEARIEWEWRKSIEAAGSDDRETRQGSFRIERAELDRLGLGAPRAFPVRANTLLVADTFGFHARGESPRPSRRIEVFAYGPRTAFRPWAGLGLPSSVFWGEWSTWSWRLASLKARLGGAGRPGVVRRRASAYDPLAVED
jgi:hypothetical protein